MDALGWPHRPANRGVTAARGYSAARLEFAACLGLFTTGIYATSFGPSLSVLARDFGVSLDSAGLLITVLFVGSISASAAMAAWLHKRDPRQMSVAGMALVVVGCLSLGFAPNWPAALAGVLVTGLGDGLLVAGTHMVVARASPNVPRAINRLNLYFAVGAICGPLWAGGMFALDADARVLVFPAMALLAVPVGALLALTPSPPPLATSASSEAHHPAGAIAWFMGLVLFLYVGAEFGLGSWVASYSEQEFEAGIFTGALVTSGYWGALMIGRFISGRLFAAGWHPRTVLLGALSAGMVTSAGVALANDVFAVAVGCAFATGLCFGPIWPAAISIVSERSGGGAPAAMVTVGNAGGVFFPGAQGRLIVESGATTGIALTAVLCLIALMVARSAPRVSRRGPAPGA